MMKSMTRSLSLPIHFDTDVETDDECSVVIEETRHEVASPPSSGSLRSEQHRTNPIFFLLIAAVIYATLNMSQSVGQSFSYSSTSYSKGNARSLKGPSMRTRVRGTTVFESDDGFTEYAKKDTQRKKVVDMSVFDRDSIIERDIGAADGEFEGIIKRA